MVHLYSGTADSYEKIEEALDVLKRKGKLLSEKMCSGGCYMKTIAEHTGVFCDVNSSPTLFSVSVHCHQWREWLWEDRKCPPDCPAFDFLGKGTDHSLYVLWLQVSAG